tara:strand:+ start:352 stop:669 length:318 start_codon:yes stop_codon:yes gene_type:complete
MIEKIVDNIIILIGENSEENDNLIKEKNKKYFWFHLKNGPSPHGIIKTDKPTNKQIYICANLVKENSKQKNMKNVYVEYTQLKNIRSTKILGTVILKNSPKYIKI